MEFGPLLFPQVPLQLSGMRITPQGVTLVMVPTTGFSHCPTCGQRSHRVHSHYRRTLQDVPAWGRVIGIELCLRRFFCDFAACSHGTFAEPLPQVAQRHARKTSRLIQALRETAFTAGGEAGARLARELGMPTSGDTLLRLIRRAADPAPRTTPRVLGVDDWAMRRGQVYGTILCDLESHQPVDLLPDRSSETLAHWLGQHPGVGIISRDRGGDYAKGASQGAPGALQVADRWHLLHNLTDALQRAINGRPSLISELSKEVAAALTPVAPSSAATQPPSAPPAPRRSRADQKKQQSRARRLARYQQVQELRRQGMGIRRICRMLNMSKGTVKRFARCEQFPERATPCSRSGPAPHIDAYLPYLKQRWQEGCDNTAQLFAQIKAKGFTGSLYMVGRQVRPWRRAAGSCPSPGPRPIAGPRLIRLSARRIAWLALGHVPEPTAQDQAVLRAILPRWPELAETAELCRQFSSLLKEHAVDSLEAWVQLAEGPGILPEVRRFAQALRQDWAAVAEGVRQPWSQGQVEGQINRLKLMKRQMYGRASFDLLRRRVLHAG
jgi:transposase